MFKYLDKYTIELDEHHEVPNDYIPRMQWKDFIVPENQHLVSDAALDLLGKLLRYDHQASVPCRFISGRELVLMKGYAGTVG